MIYIYVYNIIITIKNILHTYIYILWKYYICIIILLIIKRNCMYGYINPIQYKKFKKKLTYLN